MSAFLAITANRLGVKRDALPSLLKFYKDVIGMDVDGQVACFGAPSHRSQGSTALEFLPSDGPNHMGATGYWKIGLGLPDVNAAVKILQTKGVQVGPGHQFLDVGFLTHMADEVGYTIELLQDTFEANFKPCPSVDKPLGCLAPKVGQITLRVSDIQASLGFYRDVLGMKFLCWYPVAKYGFELYFLAFTDDNPPDSNLDAEVNREWTYSRSYTTLELQVSTGAKKPHTVASPGAIGWQGLVVSASSMDAATAQLAKAGISVIAPEQGSGNGDAQVKDPDGYSIWLRTAAEPKL